MGARSASALLASATAPAAPRTPTRSALASPASAPAAAAPRLHRWQSCHRTDGLNERGVSTIVLRKLLLIPMRVIFVFAGNRARKGEIKLGERCCRARASVHLFELSRT